MEIGALKRDAASVEDGMWVDEIPGFGDGRLRVRGLTSMIVITARNRKERKVQRKDKYPDGTIKEEVKRRIMCELLHEVVLLEWDCFTHNGKPVPYDAELAKTWCMDRESEPFADGVTWAASFVDNLTKDEKEALAKNFKRPSDGSSSGAPRQTA